MEEAGCTEQNNIWIFTLTDIRTFLYWCSTTDRTIIRKTQGNKHVHCKHRVTTTSCRGTENAPRHGWQFWVNMQRQTHTNTHRHTHRHTQPQVLSWPGCYASIHLSLLSSALLPPTLNTFHFIMKLTHPVAGRQNTNETKNEAGREGETGVCVCVWGGEMEEEQVE